MRRYAALCAVITMIFLSATLAAYAEEEMPQFIPPYHWTYHSLAALSSAGLLEDRVVPGKSAFTPAQAASLTVSALKNAEDDVSKLGAPELSALRQLTQAYRKYFSEAGYEYDMLLGDIDTLAMRAGLSAAAEIGGDVRTPAAEAAASINKFALSLYVRTASEHGGLNMMVSPYSVASALACAYEGARGVTEAEMERVLHFSPDINVGLSALTDSLRAASSGDTQINIANALWYAKGENILHEFEEAIEQYGFGISALNFKAHPSSARDAINRWTEKNTGRTIKEIVPPGAIDRDTRFVITNAIYFKSLWADDFDKAETQPRAFYAESGSSVQALTMCRTGDEVKYADALGVQAISMPYSGGQFSMIVLLPDREVNFWEFERTLSVEMIGHICSLMEPSRVRIYLPKFRSETACDLSQALAKMGMPSAFDESSADFSGMTGRADTRISNVFHKTFIDVSEEGTEASAATAVIMMRISVLPGEDDITIFRADHPFIYIIKDEMNGTILFIGRYMRP